jgi:predicted polyphosphate/ATP-dependent NAD kinase
MRHSKHKNNLVGILANPASGRDVRRLVAMASVFPNTEKSNMVLRILSALGSVGVPEVIMMPDRGGIASRIHHTLKHRPDGYFAPSPVLHFLDMPIEDSAVDTIRAVERMVELGVAVIIVMGGDGTHRIVASVCGETPLVALSTGTNNVFPEIREATIAGLAAGLVAMEKVRLKDVSLRNKVLRVDMNGFGKDLALVDLCISTECWIGARALWQTSCCRELFVTFAQPHAIGLSAIAGLLHPVERWAPYGLRLVLAPPGEGMFTVHVPIAPGLVAPVGIADVKEIYPKEIWNLETSTGTIALDGEREIEFNSSCRPKVWLEMDGPITIDINRVMLNAAKNHNFVETRNTDLSIDPDFKEEFMKT